MYICMYMYIVFEMSGIKDLCGDDVTQKCLSPEIFYIDF